MSAYISVFDMLKIGIGPSSSHTLGPWSACDKFIATLKEKYLFQKVIGINVKLYGSLSLTGKGHATDVAICLGLSGEKIETINPETIKQKLENISKNKVLNLNGENSIIFNLEEHIVFSKDFLPFHSNGMRFTAFMRDGSGYSEVYYSIGGGFIVQEDECPVNITNHDIKVPFNIVTGNDLNVCLNAIENSTISSLALKNEVSLGKTEGEIEERLMKIWGVMQDSIFLGANTEGILPGGLNVKRRACSLSHSLLKDESPSTKDAFFKAIKKLQNVSFTEVLDWVNVFALAVNEVNASLGRIVTAPTNGSAGVIPAVLSYYVSFVNKKASSKEICDFLLTAGLIGGLFKNGATISAAAGGCQAEIGVSSAMAAAALTQVQGGTPKQCMVAAEIAMEHHLGMTCDPIGGLVQIPCIERNTMGAIKAINAAQLAIKTVPAETIISLDSVIKAMHETAQDMNVKYKETSMGGLALQVSVNNPEC